MGTPKALVLGLLVAAASASQLTHARPGIAARPSKGDSLALRLRGGSTVAAAPQPKALRGGGAKPLFMGMDLSLLSYFFFWRAPAATPRAPCTNPRTATVPQDLVSIGRWGAVPCGCALTPISPRVGTCSTTTTRSTEARRVRRRRRPLLIWRPLGPPWLHAWAARPQKMRTTSS